MPSLPHDILGPFEPIKPIPFKPPEPEKTGVMCTVCKNPRWGVASIGDVKKCLHCGNTDKSKFINVSSADFNRFSGRYTKDDKGVV
jgi:hypothetical protein